MGGLAGFKYREVAARLRRLGLRFPSPGCRVARKLAHPATDRFTTIPNHPGDMPEGTLRAILKQARVSVEAFLDA